MSTVGNYSTSYDQSNLERSRSRVFDIIEKAAKTNASFGINLPYYLPSDFDGPPIPIHLSNSISTTSSDSCSNSESSSSSQDASPPSQIETKTPNAILSTTGKTSLTFTKPY